MNGMQQNHANSQRNKWGRRFLARTRPIILTASVATAVLTLASCFPTSNSGTSSAYRAPSTFAVDPVKPRLEGYPEFSSSDIARTPAPELPELAVNGRGSFYKGVQPLEVMVGNGATPGNQPVQGSHLDPRGIMPVEQLIYGGSYPERDEPTNYRLSAGDTVRITVEDHPEFNGVVAVENDGVVKIPGTEDVVDAENRLIDEITREVEKTLTPYVNHAPAVKIRLHTAIGGYYFIFGEVVNAGRFPIGRKPIRLSEAVFRANSQRFEAGKDQTVEEAIDRNASFGAREKFRLPPFAKLESVSVITPHRSHPIREEYDLKSALLQGVTGQDPMIRPGQIVFVNSTANKNVISMFRVLIAPIVLASRGIK